VSLSYSAEETRDLILEGCVKWTTVYGRNKEQCVARQRTGQRNGTLSDEGWTNFAKLAVCLENEISFGVPLYAGQKYYSSVAGLPQGLSSIQ
jgi:hypothetical protein